MYPPFECIYSKYQNTMHKLFVDNDVLKDLKSQYTSQAQNVMFLNCSVTYCITIGVI